MTRLAPAIDIDLLDEAAAIAVEELARERFEEHGYFLVRIGRPPKRAILLRTDEPFKKIMRELIAPNGTTGKLEILCDGQQLVVAGIHPETRRPYCWHGGEPGKTTRKELPYVREADMRAFADDTVALLGREHGYREIGGRDENKNEGGNGDEQKRNNWDELIDGILSGAKLHDAITPLAAKLVAGGMMNGAAINLLRAIVGASAAPHDRRWQQRYDEIPRAVASAEAKPAETKLSFVDMAQWDGEEVPTRQWSVPDRLPLRQPALFSGEGATGKTILELQLCAAHVLGRDWLDTLPEPGPAIYLGAEDETDELHRRLADIAKHYGVMFADLINGGLHLICLAGKDALLGTPDRTRTDQRHAAVQATGGSCRTHQAETYRHRHQRRCLWRQRDRPRPGPAVHRAVAPARHRCRRLGRPPRPSQPAGHQLRLGPVRLDRLAQFGEGAHVPAQPAGREGRAAGQRPARAAVPQEQLRPPGRAHRAPLPQRRLRARAGMSIIERAAREKAIDDAFLAVLGKLIASNRPVNPSPNAANYAPTVIAGHPDGKAHSRKDYQAAMERLLDASKIHIASDGPPSKKVRFLALGKGAD